MTTEFRCRMFREVMMSDLRRYHRMRQECAKKGMIYRRYVAMLTARAWRTGIFYARLERSGRY